MIQDDYKFERSQKLIAQYDPVYTFRFDMKTKPGSVGTPRIKLLDAPGQPEISGNNTTETYHVTKLEQSFLMVTGVNTNSSAILTYNHGEPRYEKNDIGNIIKITLKPEYSDHVITAEAEGHWAIFDHPEFKPLPYSRTFSSSFDEAFKYYPKGTKYRLHISFGEPKKTMHIDMVQATPYAAYTAKVKVDYTYSNGFVTLKDVRLDGTQQNLGQSYPIRLPSKNGTCYVDIEEI